MYDTLNNTTIHASTFTFSYHVTKSIKSLLGVTEIKATPPPLHYWFNYHILWIFFYYLHILIFGLLQLKHFFSLMQEKHIYRYIIVCFPYFFLIDLVFDPQLPTCTVYIGLLILSWGRSANFSSTTQTL